MSGAITATITAFEKSPDRGRRLARDMRVRWAFGETGQPYDVRLVSFDALKQPAHRRVNPFGQIPTGIAAGVRGPAGGVPRCFSDTFRQLNPDCPTRRSP